LGDNYSVVIVVVEAQCTGYYELFGNSIRIEFGKKKGDRQ